MTEFKQIIGRGTRINEDYNKLYFTIMDFKRATALFADPDFDGDPVQIYEPGPNDPPTPPDDPPEDGDPLLPEDGLLDPIDIGLDGDGHRPTKYYVDDVEVIVATERVQYLGADGKLITESLKDYTRKTVQKEYQSLDAFLTKWNGTDRKHAIVEELANRGVFLDELADQVGNDLDAFDLICHVRLSRHSSPPGMTSSSTAKHQRMTRSSTKFAKTGTNRKGDSLQLYCSGGSIGCVAIALPPRATAHARGNN